jgi:predicted nucleic acid-binding protein
VARVIVFDPSVLIAYLDSDDELHGDADTLLSESVDDDFGANSFTLAEVLVVPARAGRLEAVETALHELEMDELPFPVDTAVRLAHLRVSTGLKMPDCCVLLAAEDHHATVASFDDRLTQAAKLRGLDVLGR